MASRFGAGVGPGALSPAPTSASSMTFSAYAASQAHLSQAHMSASMRNGPGPPGPGGYMRMPSGGNGMPSQPQTPTNGSMRPQAQVTPGSNDGVRHRRPDRKDTKETAWVHWRALRDFLAAWADKESPTARASAREKLTRLTRLQFLELSTDVYDELMRRQEVERNSETAPFLPVREDFHPKRNQARQKLATLPKNRFKDLASDVFFELRRRYPEFEEQPTPPPAQGYDLGPEGSPGIEKVPLIQNEPQGRSSPMMRNVSGTSADGARVAASHHRKGSSVSSGGGLAAERERINLTGAIKDVIVPNKSRLLEEEIQVPYARDSVIEPGSTEVLKDPSGGVNGLRSIEEASSTGHGPRTSDPTTSPGASEEQYYDRMSLASSVARSKPGGSTPNGLNDEQLEKLRSDYELRIAGLERRLQDAEGERDDLKRAATEERERRREYEEEVRGLKERATLHASSLRSVQHELDLARDASETLRHQHDQTSRQAQEDVQHWRERYNNLEDRARQLESDQSGQRGSGVDQAVVDELQAEVHGLLEELNTLQVSNDELSARLERTIEDKVAAEAKAEEWKRQHYALRTELRNLKATSTLFVSQPLTNDHLPASPDGNIDDVHVADFQAAIDSLLQAARSSHPSGVLPAMKAMVEAITAIGEDVKAFEDAPNLDVDVSRLELLKHESTTRLSALMTAARNHAMASGLSPVSLIDGAAGHLSANVIELIKLLKIRRSGKTRDLLRQRQSMTIGDMVRRRSTPLQGDDDNEERERSERADRERVQREQQRERERAERAERERAERERADRERAERERADRERAERERAERERAERERTERERAERDRAERERAEDERAERERAEREREAERDRERIPFGSSATSPPRMSANPPPSAYDNPMPTFRIHSFQSASSTAQKSDSFDLERKGSTASASSRRSRAVSGERGGHTRDPSSASVTSAGSTAGPDASYSRLPYGQQRRPSGPSSTGDSRNSPTVTPRPLGPRTERSSSGGVPAAPTAMGEDREWEDIKPYLNTNSTTLVSAIQSLLAAIRTGGQGPALNEHLSEVIAISSSIVAVSSSALPARLRAQGDPLLSDLVGNTDKLSEAQQTASRAGGFDKQLRQGIASASFGVAKALKALMKLGGE